MAEPKPKYLAVPALINIRDSCKGCAFEHVYRCTHTFEGVFGYSCFVHGNPDSMVIAIENTPEARAAYVALRLEQSND